MVEHKNYIELPVRTLRKLANACSLRAMSEMTMLLERVRGAARQTRKRVVDARRTAVALPTQPELVLMWLAHLETFDLHRAMRACRAWLELGRLEPSLHSVISLPSQSTLMSATQKRQLTDERLANLMSLAQGTLTKLRLFAMPKVSLAGLELLRQQPFLHTLSLQQCTGLKAGRQGPQLQDLLSALPSLRVLELDGCHQGLRLENPRNMNALELATWPSDCTWSTRPVMMDISTCDDCGLVQTSDHFSLCNGAECVATAERTMVCLNASDRWRPFRRCNECKPVRRCARCPRAFCQECTEVEGVDWRSCDGCGLDFCGCSTGGSIGNATGGSIGNALPFVGFACADCGRERCDACLTEVVCLGCGERTLVCRRCAGRGWIHSFRQKDAGGLVAQSSLCVPSHTAPLDMIQGKEKACQHSHDRPGTPIPPYAHID